MNLIKDEDAHRTPSEELNEFPENRTILKPGGCATYSLPAHVNQGNFFLHPARKQGQVYEDYCNKGPILGNVQLENASLNSPQSIASFSCFPDPTDCHSTACQYDISSVFDGVDPGKLALTNLNRDNLQLKIFYR